MTQSRKNNPNALRAELTMLWTQAQPVVASFIRSMVPNADADGITITGSLLAVDSNNGGALNTGFTTTGPTPGFPGTNAANEGVRFWEPNGTAAITGEGGVFTNTDDAVSTYTFDIADGAIIHAVYTRWRVQGNQTTAAQYSYSESSNGSAVFDQTATEVGAGFRWTSDTPTTYGFLDFQTLFSSDFTVTGGDGFVLTVQNETDSEGITSTNGNVLRMDAVIIDYTTAPIPEPGSLALLGLGGLCVLRRRRG